MPEDTEKSFQEHTEELARRLKVVLLTLIVSTVVMMVMPGNLNFLKNPLNSYEPLVSIFIKSIREHVLPPEVKLIGLQFTAPIELYVIASFIFGLAITIPVFAYEVYRFIDPALRPEERREVYPFVAVVSTLFISGVVFGFTLLFPYFIWSMFPFFTAVGAELIISIMDFYNLLFFTTVLTGLIFTFPAFFVLLVKYGVIGTDIFRRNRKYLYIVLLVLAMIVSPGSSPQGNVLLFVPMLILFELALFFARRYEEKGKVRRIRWFWKGPSCKYCGADLSTNSTFCPKCGKSQV